MPYVNPTPPTSTDTPLIVISNRLIDDEGDAVVIDVNPDIGHTLESALADVTPHGTQLVLPDIDIEAAASAADATILFADGYVGRPNACAADTIARVMVTSAALSRCTLRPPIILEHVIDDHRLGYDVTDVVCAMPYETLVNYPTTGLQKSEFIAELERWARDLGYIDVSSDTIGDRHLSWDSYAIVVDERARAVVTYTDAHDRTVALTRATKHAQDVRIAATLEIEHVFNRNVTHIAELIDELEADMR